MLAETNPVMTRPYIKRDEREKMLIEANTALGLDKNHSFYTEDKFDKDKIFVFLGCREGRAKTISSHRAIHLFRANKHNLSGMTGGAYQINIHTEDGDPLSAQFISRNIVAFSDFTRENDSYQFHICDLQQDLEDDKLKYLVSFFKSAVNCCFPENIRDKMYGIVEKKPWSI